MRTSTPRAPRRNVHAPVKTIDIYKQPAPVSHANLGYSLSIASPLIDPCAYAASVSGTNVNVRPAQRMVDCLEPTFQETEEKGKLGFVRCRTRSCEGDPTLKVAQEHDIKGLKSSMTVAGIEAERYQARQPSRSARGNVALAGANGGDVTIMGDNESTIATTTMLVTPLRRAFEGPQGSTAKRQRTSGPGDGDLSSDTVRSVLRLVDESLVETPERKAAVTPKVLKAVPGPSPREQGPTFAYGAEPKLSKYGGLFPRTNSILAPFGFTRV